MAGDWFAIDHDLPEKPEILGIHEATGVSIQEIMGRLFLFWRMFDRQTTDGFLAHAGSRSIASRCGGDAAFWDAVAAVGWLTLTEEGAAVPSFIHRFGRSARRRMTECQRKWHSRHLDEERTDCGHDADADADTLRTDCGPKATPLPQSQSQSQSQSEPESESLPESLPQTGVAAQPVGQKPDRTAEAHQVCDHYRTYHPKARPTSKSKEWRTVQTRLAEGFSTTDLIEAIDGAHITPHNLGGNPQGQKYLGLELIMRSGDQVTRFIENNRDPPRPINDRERRALDAAREWLSRREQRNGPE